MKKLILLLVFIPLVSFGQITYKDLMKLGSQDTFEKLMFDKQFSTTDDTDIYDSLYYALNPKTTEGGDVISTHFAQYTPSSNMFFFTFIRTGTSTNYYTGAVTEVGVISNDYDKILRKAKRKCDFVKMHKIDNNNYACYDCKNAEFKGYLAFALIGGQGAIANLLYID